VTVVRIPSVLRADVGGLRDVTVDGGTVREALRELVAEYPALEGRLFSGDEAPSFINVFVDGEDVRLRDGLDTPIGPQTSLLLLPAVAGGSALLDVRHSGRHDPGMACSLMKPFSVILCLCAPVA
jgi:molybdopterin converting factor small subunit